MANSTFSTITAESRRFSIRLPHWAWCLLATAVLVVAAVGLSIWMPYHREQEVIQEIKNWDRFNADHHFVITETRGPEWLRRLVGQDHLKKLQVFDRVVNVELQAVPLGDAQMAHLGRLANLETLLLTYTGVTDTGLVHLSGLTKLRSLDLDRTKITDAGLAHLSRLTNLRELHLRETVVTDAGLAHLSGLTQLKLLVLQRTPITDAGLVHLRTLTNLKDLALHGTRVTDEGIEGFKIALPDCDIRH